MLKKAAVTAVLALVATVGSLAAAPAQAGGNVQFSIGVGVPVGGYGYAGPPPAYYGPPPAYYGPPRALYAPPPVVYLPPGYYGPPRYYGPPPRYAQPGRPYYDTRYGWRDGRRDGHDRQDRHDDGRRGGWR